MIVRCPSECVTTTGYRTKGIELTDAAIAKIWPVHVVIGNFFALNQASFNLCDLSLQPKFMPSSKLGFYGCLKGSRATVAANSSPDVCKEGLWYQQETSKLKKCTRVSQF